MPTDAGSTETGALPQRSALLHALRDTADLPANAHPVLTTARALADCHERRVGALSLTQTFESTSVFAAMLSAAVVADIDHERATLVDRINAWVTTHVVHRHGAALHTETLGAVIDRMAAKWVVAQSCIDADTPRQHREPLSGTDAHLQWTRLAELADGYQDLVTDVVQHRRRLPVH